MQPFSPSIEQLTQKIENLQAENAALRVSLEDSRGPNDSGGHEADLLAMLEILDGMVWSVDHNLRFRTMNEQLRRKMHEIHGTEPRVGDLVLDVMKDLAAAEFWGSNYSRALKGEKVSFLYELALPASTRHFEYTFNPIMAGDRVMGLSCFAVDVTNWVNTIKALQASEMRFRALTEHSHDMLTIRDVNGSVLYENPIKRRILGYAPEDDDVPEGFDLVHPDDLAQSHDVFQRAIAAPGIPIRHKRRLMRKDGSIIHTVGHTTSLLHIPEVAGVVSNIRDITDVVEAHERIRINAALMHEAQRVGHFGSWELSLGLADSKRKARLHWSEEVFRILGLSPEDTQASVEHFMAAVHSLDQARVKGVVLRSIRAAKPFTIDLRIIRPDGEVRWVQKEALVTIDPVTQRPQRMVGTVQDITARKTAEEQLRASEERFRAMIEGSNDGISLVDPATNILYMSPSVLRILGYTPEEMVGALGAELVVEEQRSALGATFQRIMAKDGASERTQLKLWHKDGSLRWVDALITNMLHIPAVGAIVTNYRDITESMALQEQLAFDRSNLSALVNSTLDMMWSVDRDYRIITANKATIDVFEAAIGFRISPGDSLRVPDVPGSSATDVWYGHFLRALKGESFKVEEYRAPPYDIHTEISFAPIWDGGFIVGVASFARDITEMRKAQEAVERTHLEVRTSELQKAAILDALPAQVAMLDASGIIVAVNATWRKDWIRTGLPSEGHGVGYAYLTIARRLMGEDVFRQQKVSEGVLSVLKDVSAGFQMEYGVPVEVPEQWYQLLAAPLFDQDGAVMMHMDITERWKAQSEVQQWNTSLEDRVVERTAELLLVNEALESETVKGDRLRAEVVERGAELMASITYASSIQRSLLPGPQQFGFFTDMGLLFKPRNVVSGDFLWCCETTDHFVVAVGDCTGHGVPGAMMSMLGHDQLNHVVLESGRYGPSAILEGMDASIQRLFLQSATSQMPHTLNITDGMDLAVVVVDKASKVLSFSGAGLPLLVVREGRPIHFPASKATIGGHQVIVNKVFQVHTHQLEPGDRLCLFTDGYGDQFGGPSKKKLYRRYFMELLVGLKAKNATEAVESLEQHFTEWIGTEEQVDDVLVLLLDV